MPPDDARRCHMLLLMLRCCRAITLFATAAYALIFTLRVYLLLMMRLRAPRHKARMSLPRR